MRRRAVVHPPRDDGGRGIHVRRASIVMHASSSSSRRADADDGAIRDDETIRATFRALERRVVDATTACARAVETESRRAESIERARRRDADAREARWREMLTRSRTQTTRCVEALGRRARRDAARRAVGRWRRAVEAAREEREVREVCERRVRRETFEAWRGMSEAMRRWRTRAGEDERLTRARAAAYDASCDEAVARLARGEANGMWESEREKSAMECEVRRAFMRGVRAMSLRFESARAL